MKRAPLILLLLCVATAAQAQIQVDMKLSRLQYIAYEPVIVTVGITNMAGRDIELHDTGEQPWFGFEVTSGDSQPVAWNKSRQEQPPLKIDAGKRVTRKIDAFQHIGILSLEFHVDKLSRPLL